jgi:predicted dithiol-disulfide oxidoreductase (DUF899 family)
MERLMSDLAPAADLAALAHPPFPGESDAYREARRKLQAEEIEARRQLTRVADLRQALPPGPVIGKDYRFVDANGAEVGLIDLFGDHDTLVSYLWMYGPERKRPCPMCTNLLGSVNGNGEDIKQRVALKILGRSPVERQTAFAAERGWTHLDFVQTVGDDYARDMARLMDGNIDMAALVVYRRDGDKVRLFWASEMNADMADPGQDPRDPVDLGTLWNVLDLTPEGRGKDWYPRLNY